MGRDKFRKGINPMALRGSQTIDGQSMIEASEIRDRIDWLEDLVNPECGKCQGYGENMEGWTVDKPNSGACDVCNGSGKRAPTDEDCSEAERAEYEALVRLRKDCERFESDYVLISEDYFEAYAQGLAEELTDVDFSKWPLTCVDWSKASEELKHDYSAVECMGTTYYVRD